METKILVCCHKVASCPSEGIYFPIQCGKEISNVKMAIQGDDTGENISIKNRNYCELTALYWAWKNLRDVGIIGLVHYRRFFDFSFSLLKRDVLRVKEYKKGMEGIDSDNKLQSILEEYDIILPVRKVFATNLKKDYCCQHIPEEYEILRTVVGRIFPDYLASFDYVMTQKNKASCYNMFITKWEIFDAYCGWLFNILFEVEKELHISQYPYQARVFGFMAERLLNVYCYHHSLCILHQPILFITQDAPIPFYLYVLNNIRCILSFFLSLKK
ncbi:DUF4422 domain-containing protein [Phocaeicola sp.]